MEENKNMTIMAEQQNKVLFQDVCLIKQDTKRDLQRRISITMSVSMLLGQTFSTQ